MLHHGGSIVRPGKFLNTLVLIVERLVTVIVPRDGDLQEASSSNARLPVDSMVL